MLDYITRHGFTSTDHMRSSMANNRGTTDGSKEEARQMRRHRAKRRLEYGRTHDATGAKTRMIELEEGSANTAKDNSDLAHRSIDITRGKL